jgi:hypothetical protein
MASSSGTQATSLWDGLRLKTSPNIDASYGASMLEWVQQTFDGRMDFAAVKTNTVEDLTGRKPLRLRDRVRENRQRVIESGISAAAEKLRA